VRLICVVVVAASLFPQASPARSTREVRRILILNVFDPLSSPGVAELDHGIIAGLESSPYQIELYSEDLEMTLFPDEAHQQQFREWYTRKYHDRKPDVVIAVGLEPIKFLALSHKVSFPDTPIVFCGSTEEMLGQLKLDSDFTGVWEVAQPEKTLIAALHLQPGTKHVVVVGGVGEYDRYLEATARESFRKYESRFDFLYLTGLDMPALLERLKHLPDQTIVYHTSFMQDASGAHFIDATQSVPLIASASRAPVFVVDDVDLGRGTAGGDVLSFASDGRVVGEMAVRVLNGEKPQDIPITHSANVYMFDWRALKRWGLNESNLPPGSIVLNRQLTIWESYKWYIISGISLILFEALLIGGLLWQRARRRKAEADLAVTYDRLRLAVEAGKSVGWDWDVQSGRDQWFGDLQTMFGIPADSYSGHVEDFRRSIHPEDRELVWKAVADARQSRKPYIAEFRVVRADGTMRWITAKGKFYYAPNGDPERMLGMAVDITDRKLAEEAVRESEDKLRLLLDSTAEAIYGIDLEHRCTFCNPACIRTLGYERTDQVLGKNMHDLLHHCRADGTLFPIEECRVHRVTQTGEGAHAEDEVFWRADGTSFPTEYWSYPQRRGRDLVGAVVAFIDITERKLAEAALANVSRTLIEAQEQERTRIGRDLHDDVVQRLALLSIELEGVQRDIPDAAPELRTRIGALRNQTTQITNDVQLLSHELHSSKLEYLGIVGAAKNFCKEFGERQKLEIDFQSHDLPTALPNELSLSLFRVLQEALRNATKHSGVKRFEVGLWGSMGEIHLTISDLGAGFDTETALKSTGLGLTSMQERLRLVGGELSINSQPKGGTTIHARVPFDSSSDSARAAG